MSRLNRIVQAFRTGRDRRLRGLKRQRLPREAERSARLSAIAFARWLSRRGATRRSIAARLSISSSALSRWLTRWDENRMQLRPRGRPADDVDRETRAGILSVFSLMGPHATLTALRDLFPDVARGALDNLLARCRRAFLRRSRWLVHTLRWTRPGTVWAMDFTERPELIDGQYRYLLLIRDLASHWQLLAIPCQSQSSELVIAALTTLFRCHGAPLVLKMDNGPAFVAEEVKNLLSAQRIFPLYSPPGTPSYNGSIEAGIGSLETRAFYESARQDRPGQWTSDDVAAARLQANATVRRFGPESPTPDQTWRAHTPIGDLDAHLFRQAYDRARQRVCAERDHAPSEPESHWLRASIDRVALSHALIERGLLLIRSRRVTPPITLRSASRIS